jgi:Fe-S cluster biogenesis protein NfuA
MTGPTGHSGPPSKPASDDLIARVSEVLELIRPAVQQDGGDIELVQVTADGTVRIRFLGACVGCPSSEITLREGIARNLRERVPEVTQVLAVN